MPTLTPKDPARIPVAEQSQVGEVRRTVATFTAALGFDERRAAAAAIVATELASNVVRHAAAAGRGEVIVRSLHDGGRTGVELLAIDRGPGIASLRDAMRDGYSTGQTPGTGLGAIGRLSDVFDVSSTPGRGTAIVAQLWDAPAADAGADAVGAVCLPVRGEAACGDAWAVADTGNGRTAVIVADGLGHGLQAADAARLAVRLFHEHSGLPPAALIERLHAALRATRGAAVAVAELRRGQRSIRFAGVGNIAAAIVAADGASRSMVSHNGTVGAEARRIQEFEHAWPAGSLLLMHSDGLASQWQLGQYPGLRMRHPSVIAGVLYRDHRRERDDVTVLAIGPGGRGVGR